MIANFSNSNATVVFYISILKWRIPMFKDLYSIANFQWYKSRLSLHYTDEVKLSIILQEKVGCKSPVEALREIRQRKDNWKG